MRFYHKKKTRIRLLNCDLLHFFEIYKKAREDVDMIKKNNMNYSNKILHVLESISRKKVGAECFGFLYEPEVPEGLRKMKGMRNDKNLDKRR